MTHNQNEPEWHLLESAPEVFTELCESLGTTNVEFREVYGTDQDSFGSLLDQVHGHIFGFVFLFKWEKGGNPPRPSTGTGTNNAGSTEQPPVFFAQQLVPNACATIAMLNILMNIDAAADPRLGQALESFKDFTQGLDSNTKGVAVAGSENIRTAHNAFKSSSPLDYVSLVDVKQKNEDAFHYVAYVPVDGKLLELDGLEQQPFILSVFDENCPAAKLEAARVAIDNRIKHVQSLSTTSATGTVEEIRFSLMAVTSNQSLQLAKQLALQLEYRKLLQLETGTGTPQCTGTGLSSSAHLDTVLSSADRHDAAVAARQHTAEDLTAASSKIVDIEAVLNQELATKRRKKHDNVLRRTNYLPVVLTVLKELAKRSELDQALALSKL